MIRKGIQQILKAEKCMSADSRLLHFLNVWFKVRTPMDRRTSLTLPIISYRFSSTPKDKNPSSKHIENPSNDQKKQQQQVQTIQVSYEEFKQMKQLLKELKSQISSLQHQGIPSSSSDVQSKLNQWTKKSPAFQKSHEKPSQNQQKLFFNSLEQQLSFQLIKSSAKDQFTDLVDVYLKKFRIMKGSLEESSDKKSGHQQFLEHLKLLYLIFFRYSSLENARFGDHIIRGIVLQISEHVDLLEEKQVEKFLSILNDQSKSTKNQLLSFKQNPNEFIDKIKQNFLKENKIFNFQSKTKMNSEVLSLMCSFCFDSANSQLPDDCLLLKTHLNEVQTENSKGEFDIIYNPLNLSCLLINSIKLNQKRSVQSKLYRLFQKSLEINSKDFDSQSFNEKPIHFQDSLNSVNYQSFRQLQYEGLVYFFDNVQWTYSTPVKVVKEEDLLKHLNTNSNYIENFNPLQQLRICYAFLTSPIAALTESFVYENFNSFVKSQLKRLLIGNSAEELLLQVPKTEDNPVFQSQDNREFVYYKKMAMILTQIGVQIFKIVSSLRSRPPNPSQPIDYPKKLIQNILKYINLICLEKVELQDFWKVQSEDEQREKIGDNFVLNLTVFEFIVNLNILSKWSAKISEDPLLEETNIQLLKSLISCYFAELKRNLAENNLLGKERKLELAEELLIVILVGKQNNLTLKSLTIYLKQSDQSQAYISLLKQTIGKDGSHKYFAQYKKICESFEI